MRVLIEASASTKRRGIFQLRKMTGLCLLLFGSMASATTYYVSSSTGNDANSGTSASSAWQTVAHVNAQTFNPGDSVLFKRGDVWNESLTPPSSGSSGNSIAFDAYGSGAAPNLTGYYAVPSAAWVLVAGNAWKAPLPSTFTSINFCLFGSIWGQKVSAVSSNLTARWDFYLANGYVYVYSVGNPAIYYNEAIVPMALSNVPVININGRSWLTFQHFLVNWFDQYGVYVQGTSDHLVFANMEADSMIPQGTQPLGIYVNESAPGPGDVEIYNSEAHLNYDGFRFDGAATAITMINDKAYANRDGALVDNTGAVTYSYCHFYASSLAVAGSTDVEWTSGPGPTAGAGNIAIDTPPAVQVYQRYPAQVTLTVDDAGMTPGADTYYADTVLPVADAADAPVGAAITVGYPLAQTLISEFQGWINAGRDVTSHSMSHTYYTNTDALDIQYVGSGTGAALTISGNTLTIAVTGAADSVSYNLSQGQPQGTMLGLAQALAATGKYTYSFATPCQGPYGTGCAAYTAAALLAQDLANVSGQDVKSAVYHMQLNVTQLTTDEITLSRHWMTTNLTGLPATSVYVYPGGYETTAMQGITMGVPYSGARGALKEDLGVKDTYADGFNAQNVTSFGVNPTWMGISPAALNQHIQALVWKEMVWGVPWGIFWHLNELTQTDPVGGTEITNLIQDFKSAGATIQTNTSLVNWLLSGTQETGTDGSDYYKIPAASTFSSRGGLDFRPKQNSPVVDAGENLGVAYELDINGVNQNSYGAGWEIGAHVYEGYAAYGGVTGAGEFEIGTPLPTPAMLPQAWVNNNEGNSLFSYELSLPSTWVTGPPPSCTFHTPYWVGAGTAAGLQSAIDDVETCRTASGAGIALDIPPAIYSSANSLVIPQTNSVTSSTFLVLRSTQDSSLPNGRIVCAHGIQDNLAGLSDIGLHNPDCTGGNMYYELGPLSLAADTGSGTGNNCVSASMSATIATFTLVSGSGCNTVFPASFTAGNILVGANFVPNAYRTNWTILSGGAGSTTLTATSCPYISAPTCLSGLASTTPGGTNGSLSSQDIISGITTLSTSTTTLVPVTSAEVSAGIPILVPLANGYVAPGLAYVVDTGANQETVTPVSGTNQSGMFAVFTKTHAFGIPVSYNVGSFTLANGTVTNTAAYNDLQYMWQVQNTNGTPIINCSPIGTSSTSTPPACGGTTAIGPDHWLIEDVASSMSVGNSGSGYGFAMDRNGAEMSLTQFPSHIHLRKVWAHGDWTSVYTGANSVSSGIQFDCTVCSLVDSQISQIMRPASEGHAIGAQGSIYKIDHNWIEGGSSGIISGGFSGGTGPSSRVSTFSTTYVPFCDVEERRNWLGYPFAWLGLSPIGSGINPNISGGAWSTVRKIVQEQKEGCRILESGNLYQDTDSSGGNYGQARAYNVRNNAGGPLGSNYEATINNVTNQYNIYRHSCTAGDAARSDQSGGNGGGVSFAPSHISFNNDLWYDISVNYPACIGLSSQDAFRWNTGSVSGWTGNFVCNSTGLSCTFTGTTAVLTGMTMGGNSGMVSTTAGSATVTWVSGSQFGTAWAGTMVIGGVSYTISACGSSTSCTLASTVTTTSSSIAYTAYSTGLEAFDLSTGDPAAITGCTVTALNSPTTTFGAYTFPQRGYPVIVPSALWNGAWLAGNTTVTVAGNSALAGLSDTSGTCVIGNSQSSPQYITMTHNTVVTDAEYTFNNSETLSVPPSQPNYMSNGLFQNNILLGGGWHYHALMEGLASIDFMTDTTTLTDDHLVWPTRSASLYAGAILGNNPADVVVSPVMYFPVTPYSTTASCDATGALNVCFAGTEYKSAASMNINPADYHDLALDSTSAFAAGGIAQASDGTSMGANIAAIDTAEIQNLFVCATPCGSAGPYADNQTVGGPLPQFWGFSESDTDGSNWPTVNYAMQRFWDSPPLQWPFLNTAAGVFDFTNLDADLALAYSEGATLGFYTLARTPPWASSAPNDSSCNYTGSGAGYGDGECDPPYDLASDGSGTNATWKAWITAIATHVNDPIYLETHAYIKYWEIWNEPDTQQFWAGSIAQLARLTEDANCIITGRGVIHESGNGTATPCTATPIDPNAQIVMASAHAKLAALTYGQNELYCNNTGGIPSYELPCPNPPNAIATAVDIINFHMKPGNETGNNCPAPVPCTPESAMQWYISNIHGVLQPNELAKPLWDGEGQYSSTGFINSYADVNMAASFMPQFYLESWTLGLSGVAWYSATGEAEPTQAFTSYQQVYNWLQGATLTSPCAAVGTVWSCGLSKNGTPYLVMWDTSQSCSGNPSTCTTGNQTVAGQWTQYQDMTTASTPIAITGNVLPVGIKAVVIH